MDIKNTGQEMSLKVGCNKKNVWEISLANFDDIHKYKACKRLDIRH